METQDSYPAVQCKFGAQFSPKEEARTTQYQLIILQQKGDEELEEFAEHALHISTDVWGDVSAEIAAVVAKEAFIHGVLDKDAAFITMSQNPETLDDALAMQKHVIHDKQSLAGQSKSQNKNTQSVSFEYPDPLEPSIWNAVPMAEESQLISGQIAGGAQRVKSFYVTNADYAREVHNIPLCSFHWTFCSTYSLVT